ncbi:Imm10 family immunity protein [Xanthomonas sp. D-109]|uniref:Imm10 family immunity protein n=1 Tax=Xanthomonas sp. D-109 TaxID=2821274 RepID=UPI001ADCA7F6|nr:Imm10 family immunity protein [Xanthomonas sp. D-109]MBO9881229.1 hypothetical protein [Xanthomonas sp. D-109]
MSSFVLQARSIAVEHPEWECHLVGFADQAFDTTTYLLLRRAFSFDEQDVALRMDTYQVEWCGQDTSGYGGVSQFLLSPGQARIKFVPDSPMALAGLGLLTIVFQLTSPEYLALQATLRGIFAGSGCLLVTDA